MGGTVLIDFVLAAEDVETHIRFQLLPALVLLKTPPSVPAYTVEGVEGSTAMARMRLLRRPESDAFQCLPPSVDLKMPLPKVPAYRTPGE